MADKILRVIFSGISTLVPGAPRQRNETQPEKADVLMAANEKGLKNDWSATIDPHVPFVYVPESLLGGTVPEPDDSVEEKELGRCNIYYLPNARVTFSPVPKEKLRYHIDDDHDLGERPGSDDVAREDDMRWLADLRALLPKNAPLKSDLRSPGEEVAAIVELTGGTLKAGFPCKSVQPQTFRAFGGQPIPGLRRVLASEFSIDMTYPYATPEVKLQFQQLRKDSPLKVNELRLRWPGNGGLLVVRMGNDTKPEARLAASLNRCNARVLSPEGEPVLEPLLKPREDDFFLHYELWDLPQGTPRPLPQAGPQQTAGDRCKPGG